MLVVLSCVTRDSRSTMLHLFGGTEYSSLCYTEYLSRAVFEYKHEQINADVVHNNCSLPQFISLLERAEV